MGSFIHLLSASESRLSPSAHQLGVILFLPPLWLLLPPRGCEILCHALFSTGQEDNFFSYPPNIPFLSWRS